MILPTLPTLPRSIHKIDIRPISTASPSALPRRVLMTADAVGGVWTYALELARGLAPSGVQFALATMGQPLSPAQREEAARLPNVRVFESAYKLEWMDDPWAEVDAAGDWLLSVARQFRPELVHLNGYVHAALPWNAPVLVVAHSCVASWWRAVLNDDLPPHWAEYRRRVTAGLNAADHIAAPTRAMLDVLHAHYGIRRGETVIPNGRDASGYGMAGMAVQKQPVVLTAGRVWDQAKNIRALCEAAPQLRWQVQLAGDDCDPDGRRVQADGLQDDVQMLGRLTPAQLAGAMREAAIFALPARYEPFGLTPLEAALSGCALVLGDIPSLREVWGNAAVFVPPDDVTALADAINELADDSHLRAHYAARAARRAARYTPEAFAGKMAALYGQLLCGDDSATERRASHSSALQPNPSPSSTAAR